MSRFLPYLLLLSALNLSWMFWLDGRQLRQSLSILPGVNEQSLVLEFKP
ncbi:MAG: hypothetical protein MK213_04680 [Planctomycetes bacterium]|nr:hypothetical protein [Planctomycetota bacterium]